MDVFNAINNDVEKFNHQAKKQSPFYLQNAYNKEVGRSKNENTGH